MNGVRTYKRRAGRVTSTQATALAERWAELGLEVDGRPLDLTALFGRNAPVVLEIGFGMGDATATLAACEPEWDVLAVDVHTPGQGQLLRLVTEGALTNVRVAAGDAKVVLSDMLGPASLQAVRVFFPDPWPKARHAKRRLVTRGFLDLVADRLVDGGHVHVATDVCVYADQVVTAMEAQPQLRRLPTAPWRPPTKFERRARAAGHPVQDLAAERLPRTE